MNGFADQIPNYPSPFPLPPFPSWSSSKTKAPNVTRALESAALRTTARGFGIGLER